MTAAHISVDDWGLTLGYGLFETLRLYNGNPFLLDRHLQRLHLSAEELCFPVIPDAETLKKEMTAYISTNSLQNQAIRLSITYGNPSAHKVNLFFTHRAIPYRDNDYQEGISVAYAEYTKNEDSPIVRHKTFNQLENLLPLRMMKHPGIKEVIFRNTAGYLCEGSKSNLFWVRDGVLYTPAPECGILPGITRAKVLELAAELSIPVKEGNFMPRLLPDCDECFCTNSLMVLMPVTSLNGKPIGSAGGEITNSLAKAYKKAVADELY